MRKVDPQIQKIIVSYQFKSINSNSSKPTYVKHGGQIYLFNILGIERPVKLFKRLWELEGA